MKSINYLKEQAKLTKEIAKKKLEERFKINKERESILLFEWLLKMIDLRVIEELFEETEKECVYKVYATYLSDVIHYKVKSKPECKYLKYEAKNVNSTQFVEVIQNIVDIFNTIEGYKAWHDSENNRFEISLIIVKGA